MELYRYFDADGQLLYVGISVSALGRLLSHRRDKWWWPEVASITVEHLVDADRRAAQGRELDVIAAERPKYNLAGSPLMHTRPIGPAAPPLFDRARVFAPAQLAKAYGCDLPTLAELLAVEADAVFELWSASDADRYACALGLTPWDVWPTWSERALEEACS